MRQKINVHVRKAERERPEYYAEFVQKFEAKHTTDDCMTPEPVYQAVLDWARAEYDIGPETRIVRPFWPGADYRAEDYSGDCMVIDNPPFSILSEICRWYQEHRVRFLLFAPTLTLFSTARGEMNYIVCMARVTYENGAKVNTSFITNMGEWKIHCAPELQAAIKAADDAVQQAGKTEIPKYDYPPNVCSAARLQYISRHGVELKIRAQDTCFIRALDAQKQAEGRAIYGAGFLLSDSAAAEKAAAEKAAEEKAAEEKAAEEKANVRAWELSDREREIIAKLSGRN